MEKALKDVKVAILVANGFEQVEMTEPRKALEEAGAETVLVSPTKGFVKGWKSKEWGDEFIVDMDLKDALNESFDAILIPGGVMSPDILKNNSDAVNFVREFVDADKPIAAICHGPSLLINAFAVEGRTVTSWPSIRSDLMNAGANWIDREVAVDGRLVTSRKPADIPAFNEAIIKLFQKINTY